MTNQNIDRQTGTPLVPSLPLEYDDLVKSHIIDGLF